MSQEYDRTNTFVLFVNDQKDDERSPDRSGTLNVDGVEYFMDGWIKQGKSGPFLSWRIKKKKQQAAPARGRSNADEEPAF